MTGDTFYFLQIVTLSLQITHLNNPTLSFRDTQPTQNEKPAVLLWSGSGDKGDEWHTVSLHTTHEQEFWVKTD